MSRYCADPQRQPQLLSCADVHVNFRDQTTQISQEWLLQPDDAKSRGATTHARTRCPLQIPQRLLHLRQPTRLPLLEPPLRRALRHDRLSRLQWLGATGRGWQRPRLGTARQRCSQILRAAAAPHAARPPALSGRCARPLSKSPTVLAGLSASSKDLERGSTVSSATCANSHGLSATTRTAATRTAPPSRPRALSTSPFHGGQRALLPLHCPEAAAQEPKGTN